MKPFLLLLSLFLFITAHASVIQTDSVKITKEKKAEAAASVPFIAKNVLKINLSSLAIKTFNVQYEYAFHKLFSFAVQGGLIAPRHIPSFITKKDPTGVAKTFVFSGYDITPEGRFYLGSKKGAPRGFYLAPYLRYLHYGATSNYDLTYTNTSGAQQVIALSLKGTYSAIGLGLMIGSQFFLSDHVTIDWFIGSAHYGKGKAKLHADADFSQVSDLADIEKKIHEAVSTLQVDELTRTMDKAITGSVNKQGISLSTFMPYIGGRIAGINIGIAF